MGRSSEVRSLAANRSDERVPLDLGVSLLVLSVGVDSTSEKYRENFKWMDIFIAINKLMSSQFVYRKSVHIITTFCRTSQK